MHPRLSEIPNQEKSQARNLRVAKEATLRSGYRANSPLVHARFLAPPEKTRGFGMTPDR
jgi:hypothetical protein